MFLLGIVCLVATGLFWVLVGAIVGATERRGLSTALLLILLAVGLLACSRFALWLQPDPELPRQAYLVGTLSFLGCGLFDYLMMLTMGRAMRNGPNGVVWTVTQSGVIFPFLFGVIFYSVPLNGLRVLGMVATLAALVCNGVAKGRASAAMGVPASPPAARSRSTPRPSAPPPRPPRRTRSPCTSSTRSAPACSSRGSTPQQERTPIRRRSAASSTSPDPPHTPRSPLSTCLARSPPRTTPR